MEPHDLDGILERAHRASVRLMTVAGLVSGLLLGVGWLALQAGNTRLAVGIWAVGVALAIALWLVARELRGVARSVVQVGLVAFDARAGTESAQTILTQRVGELQGRLQRLEGQLPCDPS